MARVHTVVVTHSHPDHFGLAGRLQAENGADLLTHECFRTWWNPDVPDTVDLDDAEPPDRAAAEAPWERQTPWGGESYRPPAVMAGVGVDEFRKLLGSPTPTIRVEDAEVVRLGRREWVAVHTPGHTPDHLCLLDPAAGMLLSGDHVLPTITPHISGVGDRRTTRWPSSSTRSTACSTLDGVRPCCRPTVIRSTISPAGSPTSSATTRSASSELRKASVDLGRAATVQELSQHLFSPRAWGPMAESETYAHLEHLRRSGQAERRAEHGELLYSVPA